MISFYLIAASVTAAAYTSAITSNDNGTAVTVAIFGLALTVIASAAALGEVDAASQAVLPLTELQDRVARRLQIDSIRMVSPETLARQRRFGAPVSIGLALALNISALIYALVQ